MSDSRTTAVLAVTRDSMAAGADLKNQLFFKNLLISIFSIGNDWCRLEVPALNKGFI